MPESKSDVLQGTLDLMALKTLESMGPLHGYGIARRIEQVSANLSCSIAPGTASVGKGRMGHFRNQPPGQVLFTDPIGAQSDGAGNRELGTHCCNDGAFPGPVELGITDASDADSLQPVRGSLS